jgi:hypothetical protein
MKAGAGSFPPFAFLGGGLELPHKIKKLALLRRVSGCVFVGA